MDEWEEPELHVCPSCKKSYWGHMNSDMCDKCYDKIYGELYGSLEEE